MLVAGVVILFLVYWFFFRKKKTESSYDAALPLIGGNESGYRTRSTALSGPVTRKTLLGSGVPAERTKWREGNQCCYYNNAGEIHCDYVGNKPCMSSL